MRTFVPGGPPARVEPAGLSGQVDGQKPVHAENGPDEVEAGNSSDSDQSESVNVWPDEAAESAFLAESREPEKQPATAAARPAKNDEEPSAPLPKLDELVSRIPAETRDLLDELFRAKFTTVRRVKQSDLKSDLSLSEPA